MKKILLFFACLIFSGQAFAITANDDAYAMNYSPFGQSFSRLVTFNDSYSGSVTVTLISGPANISLAGANVSVGTGVPVGIYTLTYQICETAPPYSCDTATITVLIGQGVSINAISNSYCIAKGATATTLSPTLLVNDSRNGSTATTANTDMVLLTNIPGISLLSSGAIKVENYVAPGVYVLQYDLCHNTYPALCDAATITITVGNPMSGVSDQALISYDPSTQPLVDILNNDTYNGGSATPANVNVTILSVLPPGLTYNPSTGEFTSTGLATGIYEIQYEICDASYPCSCKTATATIIVTTDSDELSPSDVRADNLVRVSGVQSTDGIIIAGDFLNYGGSPANKIAKLNPADLTQDITFNDGGPDDGLSSYIDIIKDFKVLPNDYIVVVGKWPSFNGVFQGRNIAVLAPDGTPGGWSGGNGTSPDTFINAVEIIPGAPGVWDFVLAGTFYNYHSTTVFGLARVSGSTGIVSPLFNTYTSGIGGFGGGEPLCLAYQSGKIIVGGNFTSYRNQPVGGIVRVDANTGLIDPSFDVTGVPSGSSIHKILINGSDIYVGGNFASYDGDITRKNIVKLTSAGAIVPAFAAKFDGTVRALSFQETPTSFVSNIGATNLYVGGDFANHIIGSTTTSAPKIACLNPGTGVKNPLFNPGTGPNNAVHTISLENSKVKVILGGAFTQYHGTQAQRVTRIFPGYLGAGQQGRLNMFDNADTTISIYPNPSEGLFTIDLKGYDEQRFNITVHNTLGQLIYSGEVTAQSPARLDLSSVTSGNYFVTLQNSTETINKIIVKK